MALHLQIRLREFECNFLACQPLVNGCKRIHFVFNVRLLVLVQMNFNKTRAIQTNANSLSDNFSREDQVLQDVVMNSSQSTAVQKQNYK